MTTARRALVTATLVLLCAFVYAVTEFKVWSAWRPSPRLPGVAYVPLLLIPTVVIVWVVVRLPPSIFRWLIAIAAVSTTVTAPWRGRTERVVRTMRWEVIPRGHEPFPPDVAHIRFRYAEHPGDYIDEYSSDLLPYLRARGEAIIPVEIDEDYDLCRRVAVSIVRVGNKTEWNSVWGGAGHGDTLTSFDDEYSTSDGG